MSSVRDLFLPSSSVLVLALAVAPLAWPPGAPAAAPPPSAEHRVLATTKTSTMEAELNAAGEAGFRFRAVMGGETAFGGTEVVVVVTRTSDPADVYAYRLLATTRTSTMQKELDEAAAAGYEYVGQTVFKSLFGGDEVVVILERNKRVTASPFEYRLVATSKTSTLQKELLQAGSSGYEVVGLTVGRTAMGGKELVAITRRPQTP